MVEGKAKRIRRTPEAAKSAILEAAERRLIEGGPASVRVQHIAADLGMTDAAVHHHFESREALIDAARRFAARRLLTDIDAILDAWDDDKLEMGHLGKLFRKTYSDRGASRLIFWVALSGHKPRGSGLMQGLIDAVHKTRMRRAKARGRPAPSRTDTRFVIALLSTIHAMMPVAGDAVLLAAGIEADEAGRRKFLTWVEKLLDDHLNS